MIADEFFELPTRTRVERFRGNIIALRSDDVEFGADVHTRDYVVHFGAVAVVALDADDRVLLIKQYRHPVAARLWEIPAGLLDHPDEDPLTAAQRELAEETGFLAAQWNTLIDYAASPGGSTDVLRVYLARDLTELPERPSTGEAEELDLEQRFVPFEEIHSAVLAGLVGNTALVAGVLAAHAERALGWVNLRAGDCAWPMREHLKARDRIFIR